VELIHGVSAIEIDQARQVFNDDVVFGIGLQFVRGGKQLIDGAQGNPLPVLRNILIVARDEGKGQMVVFVGVVAEQAEERDRRVVVQNEEQLGEESLR
jgi:hypothetical protein